MLGGRRGSASSHPRIAPGGGRRRVGSASASTYVVPDDQDYVSPTVKADRGRLHLEGRYNYEGLGTASLWAGYTFSAGTDVAVAFTLMLGGIVGDTDGVAPGYLFDFSYRKLTFYSESEYVIASGVSSIASLKAMVRSRRALSCRPLPMTYLASTSRRSCVTVSTTSTPAVVASSLISARRHSAVPRSG